MKWIAASGLALFFLIQPAASGSFEDGAAAALRGDYATTMQLWQPLAEGGDAAAQHGLGLIYSNGYGVPQDDLEAVRWFRLAAEQSYMYAQYDLGAMYDKGRGVPQDFEEAIRWYRLAAKQGDARAWYNLGDMYANGQGIQQDYAEAVRWFKLGAEKGMALAQNHLGAMYALGNGVTKDVVQAYMWYEVASSSRDAATRQRAVGNRALVTKEMTPDQIAKALVLAQEWLAAHPKP